MNIIRMVLKEPLLHFLALGFALFLAYNAFNPDMETGRADHIVVDRESLLTYMQYRAKAFNGERAQQQLNSMPDKQRQQLVDDYIREETLYREAKALQLDKNDSVARQRLIQQMRYVVQSIIGASITLSDAELREFQAQNRERYFEPAKTTFTHVFFSSASRPKDEARQLAQQQLSELNENNIPFHQAPGHGDRFLYHRNYVQKDAEFIASHFGEDLQTAVFDLPASDTQWQGPYPSPYGYHLVLVTQQTPEYHPTFDEVKGRVTQDAVQARRQQQVNKAIDEMIARYEVTVALEQQSSTSEGGV